MFDPGNAVLSGELFVSVPIAMLAGLLSFASPCILPLVPGYLGLMGSLAGDAGGVQRRSRLVAAVLLFIAGFTVVFVLGNAVVGGVSSFLLRWNDVIIQVLGGFLMLLGLVFIGQFSFLQRVWKPSQVKSGSLWTSPLVGVVFAVGWTPCSGPTLAAIGALTVTTGSAGQGALLGLFYALGLGIPFFLMAIGFGWASRTLGWMRRHMRAINLTGGIMLMLVGLLMVSGLWVLIMNEMQLWILSVETII